MSPGTSPQPLLADRLRTAALAARSNAYAPYSGYPVGAALMDEHGQVWSGCNVENVSYGLSVCAERNAIAAMVANGGRRVLAVLVVTEDGGAPCGACLQVLAEFAPEASRVSVILEDADGTRVETSLGALMPSAFRSSKVSRTDGG